MASFFFFSYLSGLREEEGREEEMGRGDIRSRGVEGVGREKREKG